MNEKVFFIIGNIVEQNVDAIVNSTGITLNPGFGIGSIDSKIHEAAGIELDEECKSIAPIEVGNVAVTDAYNLKCKKIIHAAGPIWSDDGVAELQLEKCYFNIMKAASDNGLRTVAIPSISTGYHRCPIEVVANIAVNSVADYIEAHENDFDKILFVLRNQDTKDIYDNEYARRQQQAIKYLTLRVGIQSYDDKEIADFLKRAVDEFVKQDATSTGVVRNLLKRDKTLRFLDLLIDQIIKSRPEDMLTSLTENEIIKKIILRAANKQLQSREVQIFVRNFAFKSQNKKIYAEISIDHFDYTDIMNLAIKHLQSFDDMFIRDFLIPELKIVDDTISDDVKTILITNTINGLADSILRHLEKFIAQKGVHILFDTLKLIENGDE